MSQYDFKPMKDLSDESKPQLHILTCLKNGQTVCKDCKEVLHVLNKLPVYRSENFEDHLKNLQQETLPTKVNIPRLMKAPLKTRAKFVEDESDLSDNEFNSGTSETGGTCGAIALPNCGRNRRSNISVKRPWTTPRFSDL